MSKETKSEKPLEGFAAIMKEQLEAVNNVPKFKEQFATTDLKVLFVATNMYPAALIHVDHGVVRFYQVSQEDCKDWKKTGAQGLMQCTTNQFLQIQMGTLDPTKAWLKRQIVIHGSGSIKRFNGVIDILKEAKAKQG